jgi:hypothetical protein
MPAVRFDGGALGDKAGSAALSWLRTPSLCDGRNHIRWDEEAIADVVLDDVVRYESEAWGERPWAPESARIGEL